MKRKRAKRGIFSLTILAIFCLGTALSWMIPGSGVAYADSEDVIEFRVTNKRIAGTVKQISDNMTLNVSKDVSVRVVKTDVDTGEYLEGAEFGFYVNGTRVKTLVTDENGIATYTYSHAEVLDTGELSESYAENYDELSDEDQAATQSLEQARAKLTTRLNEKISELEEAWNNQEHEYKIVEEKAPIGYDTALTPSQTSNALSLEFESKDAKLPTGEDPELHKTSDPVTGTETAPHEMGLNETLTYTLSVVNKDPDTSEPKKKIVVKDVIPDGLQIDYDNVKYTVNSETPALISELSDITLAYNGQELIFTIAELNAGDIGYFIIPAKTYEPKLFVNQAVITSIDDVVKEIKSEITYHIVPDPNAVSDTADREVKKEVDIQIIKTDADDNKIFIEGAVFDLYVDNTKIGSVTTDKNGKASYKHTLTEKLVSDTMTVSFTKESEKEDAITKAKALAEADLDAKEDAWRKVEHTYRIVETKAPDGYRIITFPDVKSYSETVIFEVVNPKTESKSIVYSNSGTRTVSDDTLITIEKTDVESGAVLAGATFDIYENGQKLTSVVTNENGKAEYTIKHSTNISSGLYSESYVEGDETSKKAAELKVANKIKAELDEKETAYKNTVYTVSVVEVKAPDGYMTTEVPDAVTADNKITFVVKDREQGVLTAFRERIAPQTGDKNNTLLHISVMMIGVISAFAAMVLYVRLKRGLIVDDGGIE